MNCCRISMIVVAVYCFIASLTLADEPRRLTTDGRLKMDPVLLDRGRSLVYTAEEKYNQWILMRLTLADGSVEPLHPGASSSEFSASFSADSANYAFLQNTGNLHVNLVIHRGSGNMARHDPGSGFAGIRNVSMAPDGSCVLFAFPEKGNMQQIFSIDSDGNHRQTLTDGESFDACPRFSPDGRSIALASTRSGNFDIYVMSASGEELRRLTDHPGYDTRPAWSPDGQRIAFTSLRQANYDIYVIDVDGSNLRRVTTHAERDDFACWSPDGRHLVVVSERKGRHDLYLIEAPRSLKQ